MQWAAQMRAAGPFALFLWFFSCEEQIYAVPVDEGVALEMCLHVLEGGKSSAFSWKGRGGVGGSHFKSMSYASGIY